MIVSLQVLWFIDIGLISTNKMDVYMQFVCSDNCKTPLYIIRITPNKMISRKNYLFEKILQVFAFHKILAICRILISEAWYTMDILANRILCHGSLTIASKMLSFLFSVRKTKHSSCYGNKLWLDITFARVSIVYHASDIKILHTAMIL